MTIREMQRFSERVRRQASREYRRVRITLVEREMKRESDDDVRQAIRSMVAGDDAANAKGGTR